MAWCLRPCGLITPDMSLRPSNAAGSQGKVTETAATSPALAISGIEILNHGIGTEPIWRACEIAPTPLSERGRRTVPTATLVVAVYGQPARPVGIATGATEAARSSGGKEVDVALDVQTGR
jgi:hypothetical protein